MSMTTVQVESKSAAWTSHLRDLADLTKPRISAMVLVTVALSHFVASLGRPDLLMLFHILLGTTLIAASSGAFNQWLEADVDARMDRTSNRPLPAGRMSVAEVVAFWRDDLGRGHGLLGTHCRMASGYLGARHLARVRLHLHADEESIPLEYNGRRHLRGSADSDRMVGGGSSSGLGHPGYALFAIPLAVSAFHCDCLDLSLAIRPGRLANDYDDRSLWVELRGAGLPGWQFWCCWRASCHWFRTPAGPSPYS